MRAAILARGGSIWDTWPRLMKARDYDLTVAINTTINVFQADYVCALDSFTYKALKYAPRLGYLYHSCYVTSTVEGNKPAPEFVAEKGPEWQHLRAIDVHQDIHLKDYVSFSVLTAIWFAACEGAIDIDLVGVDFGKNIGHVITAKGIRTHEDLTRFRNEGGEIMASAFELAAKDVTVERWESDDE
jgi:hypothetical protein